jgi:hypothetical protein
MNDKCWAIYENGTDDLLLVLFEVGGSVWAAGQTEGPYFEHPSVSGNFVAITDRTAALWQILELEPTVPGLLARLRDNGLEVVETPAAALSWAIRNGPVGSTERRSPRQDWM